MRDSLDRFIDGIISFTDCQAVGIITPWTPALYQAHSQIFAGRDIGELSVDKSVSYFRSLLLRKEAWAAR